MFENHERVTRIMEKSGLFEQLAQKHMDEQMVLRRQLLAEIAQTKADFLKEIDGCSAKKRSAEAKVIEAKVKLREAKTEFENASRSLLGAESSLKHSVNVTQTRLREIADPRIYDFINWCDKSFDLARMQFRAWVHKERDWMARLHDVHHSNGKSVDYLLGLITAARAEAHSMLVSDYGLDPCPRLELLRDSIIQGFAGFDVTIESIRLDQYRLHPPEQGREDGAARYIRAQNLAVDHLQE